MFDPTPGNGRLTPTSDEVRALVCDRQMKPDGRVFERDVWLNGRTHVVRPAAASGRSTDKIWPVARSGLGQPRQRRVKRSYLRDPLSTFYRVRTYGIPGTKDQLGLAK